jgi:hypothetical protein
MSLPMWVASANVVFTLILLRKTPDWYTTCIFLAALSVLAAMIVAGRIAERKITPLRERAIAQVEADMLAFLKREGFDGNLYDLIRAYNKMGATLAQRTNDLRMFIAIAQRFVAKVDRGDARSRVTYAELKTGLQRPSVRELLAKDPQP